VSEPIVHPLTGEAVPDDIPALAGYEAAVDRYLRHQRVHYAFRDALRVRLAELRGPAVLPRPARRTDVQRRVDKCPRCGGLAA
jgi:hypothetical protein